MLRCVTARTLRAVDRNVGLGLAVVLVLGALVIVITSGESIAS
jgi:hypothetical protein